MFRFISVLISALLLSSPVLATHTNEVYEVTITNITKGQTFTPILAVTHSSDIALFELGSAASAELATIAESGNIAPLRAILDSATDYVGDTSTNGALLVPGQSVTIELAGSNHFDQLSFVSMLIPTNDTFVAINSMDLPKRYDAQMALAYDAGSEANDELCDNIPGPVCGDADDSGDVGEGYIYVGNGIHGIGDLEASAYDWNNPAARVVVRRVQ